MKDIKNSKVLILVLVVAACLGLMFFTSPSKLPLILVLVPFAVLWAVSFGVASLIIDKLISKIKNKKQKYMTAFILSTFPVVCLVLQSIGQFSFRDLSMLVVLAVISLFYTSRLDQSI